MRLTVIGCSPAWPNPGGACSGYLVEGRLLLDCGPGVLSRLRENGNGWPEVDAIVAWTLPAPGTLAAMSGAPGALSLDRFAPR